MNIKKRGTINKLLQTIISKYNINIQSNNDAPFSDKILKGNLQNVTHTREEIKNINYLLS